MCPHVSYLIVVRLMSYQASPLPCERLHDLPLRSSALIWRALAWESPVVLAVPVTFIIWGAITWQHSYYYSITYESMTYISNDSQGASANTQFYISPEACRVPLKTIVFPVSSLSCHISWGVGRRGGGGEEEEKEEDEEEEEGVEEAIFPRGRIVLYADKTWQKKGKLSKRFRRE